MKFPFYSSKEIWRHLGGENIQFFTSTTSSSIPDKPGIYAWYLPFDIKGDAGDGVKRLKEIFRYDPHSALHSGVSIDSFVQWQHVNVSFTLGNDYKRERGIESKWNKLMRVEDDERIKAVNQVIALASILAKPLYIGLTSKSLSARYEQHIRGVNPEKNNFHKRFTSRMNVLGERLRVEDLVFVTIPIDFEGLLDVEENEELVEVIEYILKNVIGPVYGEK